MLYRTCIDSGLNARKKDAQSLPSRTGQTAFWALEHLVGGCELTGNLVQDWWVLGTPETSQSSPISWVALQCHLGSAHSVQGLVGKFRQHKGCKVHIRVVVYELHVLHLCLYQPLPGLLEIGALGFAA